MNPQYMQYAGGAQQPPPQGMNRLPPSQSPGGFQNVPLGPPKPGAPFPPSQFGQSQSPSLLGQQNIRPPASQLPPSQLPPSQRPPGGDGMLSMQNGADIVTSSLSTNPSPSIQSLNEPAVPSQNIPTIGNQMPPTNAPQAGRQFPPMQHPLPSQSPMGGQQGMMPKPPSTMPISSSMTNHTMPEQPVSSAPTSMPGMPPMRLPTPGQGAMPQRSMPAPFMGNQPSGQVFSQPPMPGQPPMSAPQTMPGLQSKPPMPGQPQPMVGQPPMVGPQSLNQPPMPGPGQPPMSNPQAMPGQPPMSTPQSMPPMSGMQPKPGQPMSILQSMQGQPPMTNPPSMMRQPPMSMPGQPPMSGPPSMIGQPPMPGSQPMPPMPGLQSKPDLPPMSGPQPMPGQPPMSSPQSMLGQPPISNPQSMLGQPPMSTPQSMLGQPPMSTPQSLPGQPPMQAGGQWPMSRQPPKMNQPPMPGQPALIGQPPMPGQPALIGQPPMPGQPQLIGQQPPMPGQPPMKTPWNPPNNSPYGSKPMQSMPPGPVKPPMPGQPFNSAMPPQNQFNQPPMPNQYGAPPMPGQYPNPLTNQMQNMSLSGPYNNKAMNGDNGPHMPPPLGNQQQNYMNGPQQKQGYPPMQPPMGVGQPPMPGQYPAQGGYQQQQQQQQRRLDPDQMPSPIQVLQDDQTNRSGIFYVNQKGLVPPLVSTKFVAQDQGFASPRFIRSTMYHVPVSNDLMKQTSVPFGLVISPMARTMEGEYMPPVVNFGELGPVRCIRCKAYMCPFMQFIDSGRRFQCLFCKAATDVPDEYFQHLDHTGQRMDRYERPELVLGTYEFTATKDYCRNNKIPKPPAIIFVIDVSYNNIKSGMIHLLCSQMKEIIKNLPVDANQEKSNMRVGFITYNSSVHFYNIKGNLAAPQMLVVGDTQEMFMPLLDGFLCTPEESETVIDALMEQIPAMFAETRECETILMPAIVAGLEALKASECAGKLLVFHSTLPSAEAPGKLKNRDDRKLLGTDKERTILQPQNQVYNQLGQDCVGSGCSVDLFLFNNAYVDVATIGQVARLTGGEVYKYTYFQADLDGERLVNDIITNISRPIAFDAIMRVRTSTGVRPTDFYGHLFMSNTTDMELASIDCDKGIAIEIKHDDKLQEEEGIYIQIALLYTSVSGERRLRIINQALKTCSQMADLYRSCDLETIVTFLAKQATYKLLDNNPKAVKDNIVQRAAQMLASYRKNCASPSNAGQLILPECMKLLPLYVNCLLKSDAISGGADMTVDDRSFVMQAVMTMDVPNAISYFYPRLIPLHDIKPTGDDNVEIPEPIRCTVEKVSDQGVYILENGIYMFLWIGLGANQEFIQQVFGAPSAVQINIDRIKLPELNNPMSEAVRSVIDQIRIQRHRYMRLTLVRQKEKLESVFKHFLVEDRGLDGSSGYVDFLCHMHKEIRSLLS
ncbi:PREDICTED: protein transport protein Sec24C [Nicrophorus vespilloides]|uniref:Protein transport protein Sec24C n=1 Tax=Nicrophorus vespilloides TaxID=110193 RepID=A0ABM1MHM3_NICVS|nr:PREDICTED: protein transport protein Sec24C [Nicrophorus vespilloides]XP_017774074.1 PREDICTED: protein transport protein Sec24C [Nicrophorus vespilloides]